MNIKPTSRGFLRGEFIDLYGSKCSIQESSLGTERAIWLGVSDPDPKILVLNKGFVPIDLAARLGVGPNDLSISTRMHLNREQAAALLPLMKHFVETGELPSR